MYGFIDNIIFEFIYR